MVKPLKLLKGVNPKTKYIDKRLHILMLLFICSPLIFACKSSLFYVVDPTQTFQTLQPEPLFPTAEIVKPYPTPIDPLPTQDNAIQPTDPPFEPIITRPPQSKTSEPTPEASSNIKKTQPPPTLYYSQAGDTLEAVAVRYNVDHDEISSPEEIPEKSQLIKPDQLLIIPNRLDNVGPQDQVLPDSEIVFSPSAVDFDVEAFVREAGGYLIQYKEWRTNGWHSGTQVIERVAIENSINPRLLLALIEYQSHWVYGQPTNMSETEYPIGWRNFHDKGLYKQLSWTVQQLSIGYYRWRAGLITEIEFPNKETIRLAPNLNAGSVALQYLFSRLYNQREWGGVLYAPDSMPVLYEQMFGNPWLRAESVEPLYPTYLTQPNLELPFQKNHLWSYTGGPHSAWGPDGALAALDFAPASIDHGCAKSDAWVTASAAGLVTRSDNGVVVLDLDGDGYEQTGWSLLYLHISDEDRIPLGSWVEQDDPIGHPSCQGGTATGTHVHMARKYNGEWILADGPVPFVLSGWRAHYGGKLYIGTLTKGDLTCISSTVGSFESRIQRNSDKGDQAAPIPTLKTTSIETSNE
jgi:LasA protease